MAATAWADDVTFQVKAPSTVAVGNQFQVEYQLNAGGTDFRCAIEECGLKYLTGPSVSTRTSATTSGGRWVQSVSLTYTYYLMAEREGSFALPAATVKVGGKTYTSTTATVKVLPPDDPSASGSNGGGGGGGNGRSHQNGSQGNAAGSKIDKNDVRLAIDLSKTTAYEGEAILATVKLYFRNTRVRDISDAKLPDFEGFMVQDIDLPQQQVDLERVDGVNYQRYILKQYLLFPQRSGKVEIPTATVTAVAQVIETRRGGGFFFDMPMEYYQNVEIPIASPARTVTVKPLPAGRPADYMGGVGHFSVKAALSADHVKANEALTYKITIEGTGNLKYLKEPAVEFPADFEVYDPKVDVSTKVTSGGMSGRKVIEYTLIPRFAGTFELPAVTFSYFDPKTGQYKTTSSQAFTLTVERGADGSGGEGGGSAVADFTGSNQERIKVLGNDIRYIHPLRVDELHPSERPFYGTWPYWMFFLIPAVAFAIVAIIYRRQLKLNADAGLKRTRKANKLAVRRLKEAALALRSHEEGPFYEAVHKAMLGYVSDKLSIPMSELSRDNVEQQLSRHGAPAEAAADFVDILSTCEFARYAPSHDARAMDEFYTRARRMIENLEDTLKKKTKD